VLYPVKMSDILAHSRYVQVQPLSSATSQNFTNLVQFQYTVPRGKKLVLNESYLSVSIQTRINDANTPLGSSVTNGNVANFFIPTSGACMASNPVACLFSKMTHKINDIKVSDMDMVPTSDTLMQLIGQSKTSLQSTASANPIFIRERLTTSQSGELAVAAFAIPDVPTKATIDAALLALSRMIQRGNDAIPSNNLQQRLDMITTNLRKQVVNNQLGNRYNWSPQFGLFNVDDHIPGGTKHNIDFYIDSNWFRQIVYGVRNLAGDETAGSYTAIRDAAPGGNGEISNSILSIELYLSIHDSYDKIPPTVNFTTYEPFTISKTLQSQNDTINLTVPAGIYKIAVAFIDSRYGSSTLRSPTNFSLTNVGSRSGTIGDPPLLENLQEVSIQYAGEILPQTPYSFTNGLLATGDTAAYPTAAPNAIGVSNDALRAYQEFVINSDSLADSSGSVFDFATWCANPIFLWRIYNPAGDLSRDLTVKVKTGAVHVPNVHCVVMCLHRKQHSIKFDQNGMVSSVESGDSV
jgi:hypothetical protein